MTFAPGTKEYEEQQDRVHAYVAEVMRIVSGIPYDEAATTLTMSVAALMIVWAKDSPQDREGMANIFSEHLINMLRHEDIVEYIKAHTTYHYHEPMKRTQ